MPTLVFSDPMPCSLDELWAFHSSAEALRTLTPPGQRVEVEGETRVEAGALHRLRVRRFGATLLWLARIEVAEPPDGMRARFVDVAERSPFAAWRHEHLMEAEPGAIGGEGSRLTDRIEYTPPFGPLGLLADRLFLRRDLERMFAYRHAATRRTVAGG